MDALTPLQKSSIRSAFAIGAFGSEDIATLLDSLITSRNAAAAILPGTPTFTIGSETGGNTRVVTVQAKNVDDENYASKQVVKWWLSAAAGGTPGTAPSGGTTVSTGTALKEHTAETFGESLTTAAGVLALTIVEAGAATWYLNVQVAGGPVVSSAAITFA